VAGSAPVGEARTRSHAARSERGTTGSEKELQARWEVAGGWVSLVCDDRRSEPGRSGCEALSCRASWDPLSNFV